MACGGTGNDAKLSIAVVERGAIGERGDVYPILRIGFSRSCASARQDGRGWGLVKREVCSMQALSLRFDPVEGMSPAFISAKLQVM